MVRSSSGCTARERTPITRRTQRVSQVRLAIGMDSRNYYGGGPQPFYAPADFGEARMAALGWLYEFAQASGAASAPRGSLAVV